MSEWLERLKKKIIAFHYAHVLDYDIDWENKKATKTVSQLFKSRIVTYVIIPMVLFGVVLFLILWGSGILSIYLELIPEFIEMIIVQKELEITIKGETLTEGDAMRFMIFNTFVWGAPLVLNPLCIVVLVYFAYSMRSTPNTIEFDSYEKFRDFFKNKTRTPSITFILIALLTWPILYQLSSIQRIFEVGSITDLNLTVVLIYLIYPILLIVILGLDFFMNYREKKKFKEKIIIHYSKSDQTLVPEFISTKRFIEKDLSIKIVDKKFILAILVFLFNNNQFFQFILNSLKFFLP